VQQELLAFFGEASKRNAVSDPTLAELFNFVSLQTQVAGMCVAVIAINSAQKQKHLNDFLAKIQDSTNAKNQIKGALCLGEYGKKTDLSGTAKIIDIVSSLFTSANEDVRTAGSICLGNISIGNTDYFLERVFALVDKSQHQEKYLFLNTIREIIIHNSRCLQQYLHRLLPLTPRTRKNRSGT
jgi:hypothetical protein